MNFEELGSEGNDMKKKTTKVLKLKSVKAFVIDRKVWARGHQRVNQLRRRDDGKMCCLGIYLKACGAPTCALTGFGVPVDVKTLIVPGWLGTNKASDLVCANDAYFDDEARREDDVKAGFAKAGIEVTFKG
jgi:hypothetical protein